LLKKRPTETQLPATKLVTKNVKTINTPTVAIGFTLTTQLSAMPQVMNSELIAMLTRVSTTSLV
jgi:hypothetical protein